MAFLGHDAAHRQIFWSPRANDWAGPINGTLLGGLSAGWWMPEHNRHHGIPTKRTPIQMSGRVGGLHPARRGWEAVFLTVRIGEYMTALLVVISPARPRHFLTCSLACTGCTWASRSRPATSGCRSFTRPEARLPSPTGAHVPQRHRRPADHRSCTPGPPRPIQHRRTPRGDPASLAWHSPVVTMAVNLW